ncbi:hypothetical protein JTB14_000411 [Gonioctena quinquepunctata]|nr:hypothetical protein JTB14_000411 [Gonioctena quinquepunctata]
METKDTKWLRDEKEAVTYVFSSGQDKKMVVGTPSGFRSKIWQIVPVVCASLSCLPFGLMLGWPSPTNPMLLKPDSAIPITIDQSAMIAGFLMIGNTLGTPLSTKCFMESKYGILLGVTFMTVGWFLMWQARDIYWLLGSRILVGFGGGYCSGQLKLYIKDLCDDNLKTTLTKQINLYTFLAFVAIHSFGPFFNFRDNSIISLLVTIIVFFILLLLPSTPKDLIKARNLEQARKLILYVKPSSNVDEEINKIVQNMKIPNKQFGMRNVLAHQALRNRFLIFAFLVFCQQFSGAPATLIYTQILFEQSNCPYAVQFAISYALTFFFR